MASSRADDPRKALAATMVMTPMASAWVTKIAVILTEQSLHVDSIGRTPGARC